MKRNRSGLGWTLAVGALGIGMCAAGVAQAQVKGAQRSGGSAEWSTASDEASHPAGMPPGLDLGALKVQLTAFERIVNREMTQAFASPFALLQDVKGTYLPGFGVVFHLEMNLHPLRMPSMFDRRPYSEEELRQAREAKLKRVRELKTRLSALLLEHGTALTEMPADENVAVVVHLFNMPSEKAEGLPTQLVMETSRRSLLDAQAQRMTAEEFEKRQRFLEF